MKFPLVVAAFLSIHGSALADVKIKPHFSPITNLVYQLDCVGGLIKCSQNTYQNLWKTTFAKNNEDKALIQSWAGLSDRYRTEVRLEDSGPNSLPGRIAKVQLSTKLRIASFQSDTLDDYFERLDLVVNPKDREKLEKVVRHFYPRYLNWWKSTALPGGKNFVKHTEALLKRSDVSAMTNRFAKFYEAKLPENYEVHLNLFYRPDSDEPTSGQQIESYSLTEFLSTETPRDRIDVIIHELCHFFLESSAEDKFASLRTTFEASPRAGARGAYNLLNETLATVFGNGLVNQLTMDKKRWEGFVSRPESFYVNRFIDRAAKAILPWVERWLLENKTLYDSQFAEKYISSLEGVFGKELSAPSLLLSELVLVADAQFEKPFSAPVSKALGVSSLYLSQGEWSDPRTLRSYFENPSLSALFIVHPSNVEQLRLKDVLKSAEFDLIKKAMKSSKPFTFSFVRKQNVPTYVLVAPTYAEALREVEKLAALKEGFSGLLVEENH